MPTPINTSNSTETHQIHLEKRQKFEGFDFLRAIFSITVVALHSELFILAEILLAGAVADILIANKGYVAVPVFFQIALFLFYLKSEEMGSQYFQKRLPKLVALYLFWISFKVISSVLITGESEALRLAFTSVGGFIGFIIGGGYTAYYFFFSLIFLMIVAELLMVAFRRVNSISSKITISYYLLIASCALVFAFSAIDLIMSYQAGSREELFTRVYNPLNFLPYIFTTIITVQEFKSGILLRSNSSFKKKLIILLSLALGFILLEWFLYKEHFPHYARLSLVFNSWLLLYTSLFVTRAKSSVIKFISQCSLGIFGFHLLFTHVLFTEETNLLDPLSQTMPGLDIVVEFLIAVVGSILMTLIFRKVKGLKEFV